MTSDGNGNFCVKENTRSSVIRQMAYVRVYVHFKHSIERVETGVKCKIFHNSWQLYMTTYNKTKTTET